MSGPPDLICLNSGCVGACMLHALRSELRGDWSMART
jgi:hypothetical protein